MNLSSSDIRFIRSLALKKYRDESGCFTVEGEKMVDEACKSGWEIRGVWRREEIGEDAMARISALKHPSPVLAVVHRRADLFAETEESVGRILPERGLVLALDAIRDPGNLGTILRCADWFGVEAVIASPDTVDLFNPKVVQATMGALFRVPFHYMPLPLALRIVRERGGAVHGTFLDGEDIYRSPLPGTGCGKADVLVIGNEANGISDAVAACVTDRLLIPSWPPGRQGSESLNAAVATAVTLAEFRRRILSNESL